MADSSSTFTYLAPGWLSIGTMVAVFSYLFAGWRVSERLRASHSDLWNKMGQPYTFRPNSAWSMWNLARYTLLSAEHRDTPDERLATLVYLTRGLFLIALGALILCAAIGHKVTITG